MTATIIQTGPDSKLGFQFFGGAREFWRYKGPEAILSGPYETGKTVPSVTKIHALLCKYPNARGLMLRLTYTDLVNSAIVTFEKKVLPYPPEDDRSQVKKYGGEKPQFYTYPNGSRMVVAGLDKPGKVLSAEYDFIYVNQVEELSLDHWETLTGRATGRAGNAPYTQVMGDCNPEAPTHWILSRPSLKLFEQLHEHNPLLFSQETGEITEQGKKSLSILDAMTGIRYQRGRLGKWVAAEGVVYDNFSFAENVSAAAEYQPGREVIWGVDDGYAQGQGPGYASYHPRVFLLMHYTDTGGVDVFAEYYATGELSEVSLGNVLALPYDRPGIAYVDSSALELKARMWEMNITTTGATHNVSEGIKNVRRLICDGRGVRQLRIHPRCQNLIRELQMYRYDPNSKLVQVGEPKPLKLDDHGPDALRYSTWNLRFK